MPEVDSMMMILTLFPVLATLASYLAIWHAGKHKRIFGARHVWAKDVGMSYINGLFTFILICFYKI
jgi:hypothetical protein